MARSLLTTGNMTHLRATYRSFVLPFIALTIFPACSLESSSENRGKNSEPKGLSLSEEEAIQNKIEALQDENNLVPYVFLDREQGDDSIVFAFHKTVGEYIMLRKIFADEPEERKTQLLAEYAPFDERTEKNIPLSSEQTQETIPNPEEPQKEPQEEPYVVMGMIGNLQIGKRCTVRDTDGNVNPIILIDGMMSMIGVSDLSPFTSDSLESLKFIYKNMIVTDKDAHIFPTGTLRLASGLAGILRLAHSITSTTRDELNTASQGNPCEEALKSSHLRNAGLSVVNLAETGAVIGSSQGQ